MTRVVIVGEIYNADLYPSQGPIYGGGHPSTGPVYPDGPTDPGYGHPDWSGHPGNRPPGSWSGNYPSGGPVRPGGPVDPGWGGGWGGGNYPSQGPIYGGGYPSTDPIIPPISAPPRPWTPPAGSEIPDPPPEVAHNVIIAVWDPTAQTWSVATAPAAQPK